MDSDRFLYRGRHAWRTDEELRESGRGGERRGRIRGAKSYEENDQSQHLGDANGEEDDKDEYDIKTEDDSKWSSDYQEHHPEDRPETGVEHREDDDPEQIPKASIKTANRLDLQIRSMNRSPRKKKETKTYDSVGSCGTVRGTRATLDVFKVFARGTWLVQACRKS